MRNKQEVRRFLEDYAQSGMTRREFCEKNNIPVTTLDYWRHARKSKPKLVEVAIEAMEGQVAGGFALVLTNGRLIESSWRFAESDLTRLIRVAEA